MQLVDLPMKKASEYRYLEAFKLSNGRCETTRKKAENPHGCWVFYLKVSDCSPICSPLLPSIPQVGIGTTKVRLRRFNGIKNLASPYMSVTFLPQGWCNKQCIDSYRIKSSTELEIPCLAALGRKRQLSKCSKVFDSNSTRCQACAQVCKSPATTKPRASTGAPPDRVK